MANNQIQVLQQTLNAPSVKEQFTKALGNSDKASNFIADIITMSSNTNLLSKCDVNDVVKLCCKAALLDLKFSSGEAFILPFKEKGVYKPTFITSAKGWKQLMYRTGKCTFINSAVIYEGEIKSYNRFTKQIEFGERKSDKVVGYFAMFKILVEAEVNGRIELRERTHLDIWDLEYMAKYAKHYSPSVKYDEKITVETLIAAANRQDQFGLGWVNNFNSMAKKTILSHLINQEGDFNDYKMNYAANLDNENKPVSRNEEVSYNALSQNIEELKAEVVQEQQEQSTAEPSNTAPY